MASIFSHAIASYAIGKTFPKTVATIKVLSIATLCSMLPDADVIGFRFGIAYEHPLGHRGFTHSWLFALLLAVMLSVLFFREYKALTKPWCLVVLLLFLATASHGVLDAMTNGGRGVGFFIPFDNSRYFLPWRPIQVSPIGAAKFFSERGLTVIKSELVYVALPSLVWLGLIKLMRKFKTN